MKTEPYIIEQIFSAPLSKVWKAITDKEEMKKWYFDLEEFKAEVGFEFWFSAGETPEKQYLHICKVTGVVVNKRLTYSWRYEGYEGNSFVMFELFDEGSRTKLKLTHEGLESFPASNTDLARENFAKGWAHIIGTSLREYLEK
jgi:uncharacterized protein YndB with AHSA1/START domain